MKKLLALTLGCLLLCTLTTSALANEWGLRGGIYDIVSDDDRYEGYSAIADDGNGKMSDGLHVNQAILENRYHALLIAASRDGKVWQADHVNTTAVYQPGDKRGEYPNNPVLEHIAGGFKLSYGDKEVYTFYYEEGNYVLSDVRYKQDEWYTNCFVRQDGGLLFWQSNPGETFLPIGDAMWDAVITLDEFNIAQTPRSMAEVRQLTATSNALTQYAPLLAVSALLEGGQDGPMLPVYSAPDTSSYRSAEGKAAVSLKGGAEILGTAEGWTLIQYEVSPRTKRIGWVEGELAQDADLGFANVPLVAATDTFLTDDPFVSQYAQAYIPAGTVLSGLAKCGEYYAYVEYKADKLYRGFVPMKDVHPKYDMVWGGNTLSANVRWDVMDALCGKWYVEGWYSRQTLLFADGTWRVRKDGEYIEEGNYRVFDRSDGKYDLIVRTEDNRSPWYILTLNEDATITLTTTEGIQTFRRDEYSTYGNG